MSGKPNKITVAVLISAVSFVLGMGFAQWGVPLLAAQNAATQPTQIFSPQAQERRATRLELFNAFAPEADFVMIGDSITQRGHWAEFFPQYDIVNRGIGGDTAADILARMDTVLPLRPRYAFIMVGINDLSQGVSVDAVFANYTAVVETLKANDITPIIQSTLGCRITMCGGRNDDVSRLNVLLEEYAGQTDVMYLDLNQQVTTVQEGLGGDVSNDGLHLNGEGYRRWIDMLAPILQDLAAG